MNIFLVVFLLISASASQIRIFYHIECGNAARLRSFTYKIQLLEIDPIEDDVLAKFDGKSTGILNGSIVGYESTDGMWNRQMEIGLRIEHSCRKGGMIYEPKIGVMVILGSTIYIDEDSYTEFKMHDKMSLSEVPSRCNAVDRGRLVRTMQPTSKTISAFLNTHGGRIFLGVNDEGIVKGLRMSRTSRDHFMLSLHACLKRFTPVVPPELIKVQFEEVIDIGAEEDEKRYVMSDGDDFTDDEYDDIKEIEEFHVEEHNIGGVRCSCQSAMKGGLARTQLYLIVIQVLRDPKGTIYQNDEGLVYRRRHGSNRMVCIDDIRQNMENHNSRSWFQSLFPW